MFLGITPLLNVYHLKPHFILKPKEKLIVVLEKVYHWVLKFCEAIYEKWLSKEYKIIYSNKPLIVFLVYCIGYWKVFYVYQNKLFL